MVEHNETEDDEIVSTIDGLRDALVENAREERSLANDLEEVKRDRHRGHSWREITLEGSGQAALVHLGSMLARLSRTGGDFRKSLASALLSEGESMSGIARLFGVSRQRVFTLVHRRVE